MNNKTSKSPGENICTMHSKRKFSGPNLKLMNVACQLYFNKKASHL